MNLTSVKSEYKAIVNDFVASNDESGQPALLLDSGQYASSHSLKRFVKPIPTFTLKPGQEKPIKVVISVPAKAAGGGYYGAVRFAPASSANGSHNVALSGSVGSLILIKVPGDIVDNMSIASFGVRKNDHQRVFFTNNKSLDGVVRFKNNGNIQEEPFGKIALKKGDKTLYTVEINNTNPRGNVLPDSIRKFSIPLKHVGSFGKYTLEGNFGYGNGQLLSAKATFYVIPLFVIILVIILILLILFAIFVLPRWIRAYNSRVVRRASRRK
jgi:hypothetical protein